MNGTIMRQTVNSVTMTVTNDHGNWAINNLLIISQRACNDRTMSILY